MMPKRMSGTFCELLNVLQSRGERKSHDFLKKNPWIIGIAFGGGSRLIYVFPEFQLGTQFRVDFLVWAGASDLSMISVIELKSPRARLYLKDGTPSRELRSALREVRDIQMWTDHHRSYFRNIMISSLKRGRAFRVRWDEHSDGNMPPKSEEIKMTCAILIGRRSTISEEDNSRRAGEYLHGQVRIRSYDSLVDICRLVGDLPSARQAIYRSKPFIV